MSLNAIREMQKQLKEKIQNEGKTLLGDEFRKFFEANPEVQAVRWAQYAPYFNDGEPCTFSVGSFYWRKAGTPEDSTAGDYEDGYECAYYGSSKNKAVQQLEALVSDNDVMLACFGDHQQITATRDGFEVDEYSHD